MPEVHLKTRRCEYEFTITQKYNLLIGDSGERDIFMTCERNIGFIRISGSWS